MSGPTLRKLDALSERAQRQRVKAFYNQYVLTSNAFELLTDSQYLRLWHLYCFDAIKKAGDLEGLAALYGMLLYGSSTPPEIKDLVQMKCPLEKTDDVLAVVKTVGWALRILFAGCLSILTVIDLDGDEA